MLQMLQPYSHSTLDLNDYVKSLTNISVLCNSSTDSACAMLCFSFATDIVLHTFSAAVVSGLKTQPFTMQLVQMALAKACTALCHHTSRVSALLETSGQTPPATRSSLVAGTSQLGLAAMRHSRRTTLMTLPAAGGRNLLLFGKLLCSAVCTASYQSLCLQENKHHM